MTDSPTRKGRTKQKGWRVDAQLADEFTAFCAARGWNPNRQVEVALRAWLSSHGAGEKLIVHPGKPTHKTVYAEKKKLPYGKPE